MANDDDPPNTHLFVAAFEGDIEKCQKILSATQDDVNTICQFHRTPLHMAAHMGHTEVASLLIEHGAEVDTQDNELFDALMFASHQGRRQTVEVLLGANAKVNQRSDTGGTALHLATTGGHDECVRQLLAAKADTGLESKGRITALQIAKSKKLEGIVQQILDAGVPVDVKTCEGDVETYERLRKRSDEPPNTHLFAAALQGDIEKCQEILGATQDDVNTICQSHRTPLHMAAHMGHTEVASLLIEHGAEVDTQDNELFDALMFASHQGRRQTVEVLLGANAKVNQRSDTGGTALHLATTGGHDECVRQLLAAKADTGLESKGHITALHIAASKKLEGIMMQLLNAGAPVNVKTCEGRDVAVLLGRHYPYPKSTPSAIKEAVPNMWRGRLEQCRVRLAPDQDRKIFKPIQWQIPPVEELIKNDSMARLQYSDLKKLEDRGDWFVDSNRSPAAILGATEEWAANETWTLDALDNALGNEKFMVKCMSSNKTTQIALGDYIRYMQHCEEIGGHPIYLFQPKLGHSQFPQTKEIDNAYECPAMFQRDLFGLLDEEVHACRPVHKWLIVGPAGSGSVMHTDFYHTSAWNALVSGHKWWCFFPPDVPASKIHSRRGQSMQPLAWFSERLPELLADKDGPQPIQVIQRPGETLWVPPGWHHIILNIDTTVAVTQNFAAPCDASEVWKELKQHKNQDTTAKPLMDELLPRIKEQYPEHVELLIAAMEG